MSETCENRPDLVNSCVYYARQTREIYQVLPYSVDLKAPMELWNPMSKAVLSSFIWNKGPVNIWKYRKAQKYLYVGHVNIFLIFDTAGSCIWLSLKLGHGWVSMFLNIFSLSRRYFSTWLPDEISRDLAGHQLATSTWHLSNHLAGSLAPRLLSRREGCKNIHWTWAARCHHKALSLWEGKPDNNKEFNGLSTSWVLTSLKDSHFGCCDVHAMFVWPFFVLFCFVLLLLLFSSVNSVDSSLLPNRLRFAGNYRHRYVRHNHLTHQYYFEVIVDRYCVIVHFLALGILWDIYRHYTMTSWWARWRLKSPAWRLFTQQFIRAQIKENIKFRALAFVWGIHRGPVNSQHKWPVTRKMFPFDDVVMAEYTKSAKIVSMCFSGAISVSITILLIRCQTSQE